MLKLLSTAAVAMVLSVPAGFAGTSPAHAQEFQLYIGPDGVRPAIRDDDDRYERHHRHHYRRHEDRMARRGCDPDEAEYVARRYGLHHPRVVRVTPRSVTVEGYHRGDRDYMRFANVPGCPDID